MSPYVSGAALSRAPSWSRDGQVASGVVRGPLKGLAPLALLFKIVSQTIGL